jgi:hypothetical protein
LESLPPSLGRSFSSQFDRRRVFHWRTIEPLSRFSRLRAYASFALRILRVVPKLFAPAIAAATTFAQAQTLPPVMVTGSLQEWELAAATRGPLRQFGDGFGSGQAALGRGTVSYGPSARLKVGRDWSEWCCGYQGEVVWSGRGSARRRITINGLRAFGLFIEPQSRRSERISFVLSDGQFITKMVSGAGGASFFGFVGDGVRSISIRDESGGAFAFGDLRYVDGWGFAITPDVEEHALSTDMVKNAFKVELDAPYDTGGYSGNLTYLLIDNLDDEFYSEVIGSIYQLWPEGTYTNPLTRTQISDLVPQGLNPGFYDEFSVEWGTDPGPTVQTNLVRQAPYTVYGSTRHSVYNVPSESQCSGDPSPVFIVQGTTCANAVYLNGTLDSDFASQTAINGTGISVNYGVVKALAATFANSCTNRPQGSDTSNTFVEVTAVTGACGTTLGNSSVATFPLFNHYRSGDPRSQKDPKCGNSILAVNSDNTNKFVKTVADLCPACGQANQNNGADAHIDNFTTDAACEGGSFTDIPGSPFWTANTRNDKK